MKFAHDLLNINSPQFMSQDESKMLQQAKAHMPIASEADASTDSLSLDSEASAAYLFGDCMRRLDDFRCNPRQGAALGGHIADICIPLLLRQAEISNLADCSPVLVAQQQVGTLQVEMDYALAVQILHALH